MSSSSRLSLVVRDTKKNKPRRLFFDIETSPNVVYSWRVGFKISLSPDNIIEERAVVCIGYKWEGESKIHSLRWDGRGNDKRMLEEFIPTLESAHEVVAHYGDKFDLPWLRARAAYHGIPMSAYIKSVDTKAQSSRGFYFNSNRLDYLAQFFGFGKKMKTDYELWIRVMDEEKDALAYMVKYCKQDVRILEKVYQYLETYNKPKTHVGVMNGKGKWTCPTCASDNTKRMLDEVTVAGTRQVRMKCLDCKRAFKIPEFVALQGEMAKQDKQCSKCLKWLPFNDSNFRFDSRRESYRSDCRYCEHSNRNSKAA